MSRPCTWSSVNAERPATASSMRRMRGRSKRALSSAVTTSGAAVWVAKKSPSAPASRAAHAWRAIVSVMASSAGSTAAGSCRRSSTSRSPASLRATVSGEKSVCRIGALSARPRAIRRTASSSRPRAPAPGSSARIRAQSARPCTACFVHCLAPLGEPWYATAHPQSSTQYTPLDITLTKSRSQRRWKASMASASPGAVWSTSGTWRQKESGGRSTGLRERAAITRSRLSMMPRSLPRRWTAGARPSGRAAAFVASGTSRPRYGLTVREAEAGDAPRFLDRLRAGDAPAFEELVMTYQHRVFGVALRMLGNRAEAEDVAQEAFVRAHRALGEFRGDAKLSTWLYAITSRLCLNRLASGERRLTRQGEDALLRLSDVGPRPDAALERRELETALGQAIAELPEDRRIVVVLRDLEGLSYEEIAQVLELELGTVRSRLHRARADLKEKLERFLP